MIRQILLSIMILSVSLVIATPGMTGAGTAIAVAAEGQTPADPVSTVAARCPWFLLFDDQGSLVEAVANPHRQAVGGAGPLAVDFLAERGVRTVIAGEFGKKMIDAMKARGITFRTATGSAADAVKSMVEK